MQEARQRQGRPPAGRRGQARDGAAGTDSAGGPCPDGHDGRPYEDDGKGFRGIGSGRPRGPPPTGERTWRLTQGKGGSRSC